MNSPAHPDGITAEWLTHVLQAGGGLAQARVTAIARQPLGREKGMTGQLTRLRLRYDRDEAHAPHTLIAKGVAPDSGRSGRLPLARRPHGPARPGAGRGSARRRPARGRRLTRSAGPVPTGHRRD